MHALNGVSLSVGHGEMVAIMGPSGCGKTTLLNVPSGLDAVDAGDVLIDGTSLASMSDRERTDYRAPHMGFVFQFYNLMPVLSAVENVELPPSSHVARRGRRGNARWKRWGSSGRRARPPRPPTNCPGASASVTIARALVNDPAVVWADEPTGDLDSENAAEIVDSARALNEERV